MPTGTRVHRCVDKLKGKKGVNPYAICQKSTKQSYKTGRSLSRRKLETRKI
jgi:hypothetical protein